ncbi:MAG: hypothetical protein WDN45_12765 [Caulobacteraceae bacterium]
MVSGIQTEALRTIFGQDLKYWKAIADTVLIWGLGVAGVAAVVVGVSTWLSMSWSDEISSFNDRAFGAYKLTVDGKVADATKAGIDAGTAAADAHSAALKAQTDIAASNAAAERAKERSAELEVRARSLELELEKVRAPLVARRVTPDQIELIKKSLGGNKLRIGVFAPSPDREINTFANDLIAAFTQAGVKPSITMIAGSIRGGGINAVPDGLNISGDNPESNRLLEKALDAARIPFGREPLPSWAIRSPGLVFVVVGQRPNLTP